jgi:hypothetical protein
LHANSHACIIGKRSYGLALILGKTQGRIKDHIFPVIWAAVSVTTPELGILLISIDINLKIL